MLTLCVDTAYKYLAVSLIKDGEIIGSYQEECFKKQSEQVFVILEKLFSETGVQRDAIDSVCITKGPGSYTGVRISMTMAKVLCHVKKIDLFTISTLRLYAGNKPDTMVVMDARASRAYVGIYNNSDVVLSDRALQLDEIDTGDYHVVGDGGMVGKEDYMPDIAECFKNTMDSWEKVENVAYLTPDYLKDSESYYR